MSIQKSKFLRVHEVSIRWIGPRLLPESTARIQDDDEVAFLNPSFVVYVEADTFAGVAQPVTCIGVADGSSEGTVYYVRESVEQVMRQLESGPEGCTW